MALPSPRVLRRLLDYDPETGALTWKARPAWLFKQRPNSTRRHAANNWNSRFAGKPAFTSRSEGYLRGTVFDQHFKAHRVAWAIHFGAWPSCQIDHINGSRDDNRIANLRDVTNAENAKNQRGKLTNSSGCTGVYWNTGVRKWQAYITVNYETKYLGVYSSKSDAADAR
ncbi:MAG: HNH endonuclease, partial [Hyphomonas sp.]|nr:HNH endonuclease [Hyphomonas sp.]